MARKDKKGQLTVVWEVSDGYMNGNAPHYSYIPLEELEGLEGEEREQFIAEWVDHDFHDKVTYVIREST